MNPAASPQHPAIPFSAAHVSCGLAALAAMLPLILPRLGRIDALAGTALVGQGIILLATFCWR